MSCSKFQKVYLIDLPDNVLENVIVLLAAPRIKVGHFERSGVDVHSLSLCCRILNKLVNQSALNFEFDFTSHVYPFNTEMILSLVRYAEKFKCNWNLDLVKIEVDEEYVIDESGDEVNESSDEDFLPRYIPKSFIPFYKNILELIPLLEANANWFARQKLVIKFVASSDECQEPEPAPTCLRNILDIFCRLSNEVILELHGCLYQNLGEFNNQNLKFLFHPPYNSLVRKIAHNDFSYKCRHFDGNEIIHDGFMAFPNLDYISTIDLFLEELSSRNIEALTKLKVIGIKIPKSSQESLPKFVNAHYLKIVKAVQETSVSEKRLLADVIPLFPNLKTLDIEDKFNDNDLEESLKVLPLTCSSIHAAPSVVPKLSHCSQLNFLAIRFSASRESHPDLESFSDSFLNLCNDTQISLKAIFLNINDYSEWAETVSDSIVLNCLMAVLRSQPTLKVVLINSYIVINSFQQWHTKNSDFIQSHGVQLIKSFAIKSNDRIPFCLFTDSVIRYMKPSVNYETVNLISYLKNQCEWPIDSRLILNENENISRKRKASVEKNTAKIVIESN